MLRLAAMIKWTKCGLGYGCVLTFLLGLVFIAWSGTAGAQDMTMNQRVMGRYFEPYLGDPTYFNSRVLDQMSGSIYGTMTSTGIQNMTMFHNTLANVLRRDQNSIRMFAFQDRPEPAFVTSVPQDDFWGMIYGNSGTIHSDGNVGKYQQDFTGVMGGFNAINNSKHRLGCVFSAGFGELKGNIGDRTCSTEILAGIHYRRDTANTYFLTQSAIGNQHYDTKRRIGFISITDPNWWYSQTAKSDFNAPFTTSHIEAGLKYRGGILNLSPFVGAQYTGLMRKGFREKGGGELNLRSAEHVYHSIRTLFGMRLDSQTFRFHKGVASIYGNVAWVYEFDQICDRHTKFTARLRDPQFSGLGRFTVRGNDPGRDWVQTGFGVNYDIFSDLRVSLGYDAFANTNQVMHSLNFGFVYQR